MTVIASIGEGVAAFCLSSTMVVGLFFLALGSGVSGIAPLVAVSVLAGLVMVGIILKFKVWMPAIVGVGVGLVVGIVAVLFLFFMLSIVIATAGAGGQ